jgi:hypothetical protein
MLVSPKALVLLSNLPVFECHKEILEMIYERVVLQRIQTIISLDSKN